MQPNVVDLWYFKLWILLDQLDIVRKNQRFTQLCCQDIGISKFEFVAKTCSSKLSRYTSSGKPKSEIDRQPDTRWIGK